ncbi:hypothetical protein HYU92_05705 [Candidatus Curtissbacteria bacterium]|nr:hypothetical protein [Candidatus Curtissbacteria bacterium]
MKEQSEQTDYEQIAFENWVRTVPWNHALEISAKIARKVPQKRRNKIAKGFIQDLREFGEEELLNIVDNYEIWMQNDKNLDKLLDRLKEILPKQRIAA